MKLDFSQALKGLDGSELKEPNGTVVTLSMVAVAALMRDRQISAADKVRSYNLASAVHKGGEVDLPPEDVTFIKENIGESQPPIVVGPAFALLNG